MSELTTIARPYAKAAFEFAVEHKAVDQWLEMLDFAAQVAENETMHSLVNGSVAAEELAKLFVGVCGEQLNEHGQNLIRVMAENGRLVCCRRSLPNSSRSRLNWTKKFRLT